jgi:hypothetical protein
MVDINNSPLSFIVLTIINFYKPYVNINSVFSENAQDFLRPNAPKLAAAKPNLAYKPSLAKINPAPSGRLHFDC